MILWSVCILSLLGNCFLLWYLREMLRGFIFMRSHYDKYSLELDQYVSHLEEALQMELLYDEPILKSLMSHSREMLSLTNEHKEGFSLDEKED
jgi:hypothetical protein